MTAYVLKKVKRIKYLLSLHIVRHIYLYLNVIKQEIGNKDFVEK